MTPKKDELRRNIDAYNSIKAKLETKHTGQVALLSNGEFIEVYNDFDDAYKIGIEKFGEGAFSVKIIGAEPHTLGFHGHIANPISVNAL